LLAEVDPEWDAQSRKQARKTEPKVSLKKRARGMMGLEAVVTGEESAEIAEWLTAQRARVCPFDGRSPNMLRHDALMAQMRGETLTCQCGRPDCPYAPTEAAEDEKANGETTQGDSAQVGSVVNSPGRPDVTLVLHASLETILGIGSAQGQLRGYGQVSAETCRKLAADASWQVIFLAGRRYLDTLTGGEDWDEGDVPPADAVSGCQCLCGRCCCGRAGMSEEQKLVDDLLRRAHGREDRHATDEAAGERSVRDYDERWRAMNADSAHFADPNVVVGRSRVMPAGLIPDDESDGDTDGSVRSRTVSERIDYRRRRVEAEPKKDFSEFPDGHGGFDTPPPGATTYTPSVALAQRVRRIHPTCVHPGCTVPSDRCDLDHGVEFDAKNPLTGGWTIESNLTPKCRGHHNLKTEKTWRYRMLPDGVLQVTDPLGNHYFSVLNTDGR
jgi:hypothetical protein